MCGIVGYIGGRGGRHHPRRPEAARVPRLRLGGRRGRRRRACCRSGAAPAASRNLEAALRERPIDGPLGIGHTRWATHGRPSDENAHPHTDCSGSTRRRPQRHPRELPPDQGAPAGARAHASSPRRTPRCIAHLIEQHLRGRAAARRGGAPRARARCAAPTRSAWCRRRAPDRLVAAKHGAGSVVVGLGEGEIFLASDIPAILAHTRDVVILEDDDMAVVTRRRRRGHPRSTARPVRAGARRASCGIRSWPRRAATATSC